MSNVKRTKYKINETDCRVQLKSNDLNARISISMEEKQVIRPGSESFDIKL